MEEYLIKHCAPTLAGIKIANLFTYNCSCRDELEQYVQKVNCLLNEKGVCAEVLRVHNKRALIWVYRAVKMHSNLQRNEIKMFLRRYGYNTCEMQEVIKHLKQRLAKCATFPHEIGVFLGYPLADVLGFIKHKGKNSKCTGHWKVYNNEYEAKKLFGMYERCSELYSKLFSQGKQIMQLTVVA